MCMVGDEDFWTYYRESEQTARKAHVCGECGRPIELGEKYHRAEGSSEYGWHTHKTCAHCTAASWWLETVCDGWIFERREEDLREHVIGDEKFLRSRPLTRLVRWMAADWRDREGNLRDVDAVKELTRDAIDAYRLKFRSAVPA